MKKIILLLTIILFSTTAFSENVTAVQDPWPPFITGNQEKPGISVEIAAAALKTQGYNLVVEIQPWARALDSVKEGKKDMLIAAWHTDERAAFLDYSNPYAQNSIKFITTKENNVLYDGSFESLQGKKVGTIRGYGYGDDFNNSDLFSKHETSGLVVNVKKIISGRIDLTLADELVGKSILAKDQPEFLEKIKFLEPPLSENNLFVASGKKNSKSQQLISAFNKGLEEIKKNGTYDKILNKYN